MVKEEKIERLDIHSHFPAYRPRKDIYGVIKGRHRLGQPEKAITPKAKFLFFFIFFPPLLVVVVEPTSRG